MKTSYLQGTKQQQIKNKIHIKQLYIINTEMQTYFTGKK